MSFPKVIMVGGTGRCGKSITKEVIASHPDAASLPFEYRFIIDPDGIIDFYLTHLASWSPYIADRRLARLETFLRRVADTHPVTYMIGKLIRGIDPDGRVLSPPSYFEWRLNRHIPKFERHVATLLQALTTFSFSGCWPGSEGYTLAPHLKHCDINRKADLARILRAFLYRVIRDLVEDQGKSFLVEDNTWNPLFAIEIRELLPTAKIINVYRDPRDVVASFSAQRWSPNNRIKAALWYRSMIYRWWHIRGQLPPGFFLDVKLEDLVENTRETLMQICVFADIPFDSKMLELDLSHSHSGRWRSDYSPEEKRAIPLILSDIIDELGYD